MSYLDLPRLHFSGRFNSDPSTLNNESSNFGVANPPTKGFNEFGLHTFSTNGCKVRMAVDRNGKSHTSSSGDGVVDGECTTVNAPSLAKLVDLDPEFQTGSQIWGAGFQVSLANGSGNVSGTMKTGTLRDLFFGRVPGKGFADGFSGVYQSVLENVTYTNTQSSAVLKALEARSRSRVLSIKFVLYAYDLPTRAGKIVGTIGPVLADETEEYLAARRLEAPPRLSTAPAVVAPLGPGYFKVDAGRSKLILDLGNSIPEQTPGGERIDHGKLQATLLGRTTTALGEIDFSRAHYEISAGIEEVSIPASAVRNVFTSRLVITRTKPSNQQVLSESTVFLDLEPMVFRLNPGESQVVNLRVLQLGFLKDKQKISFALRPRRGGGPSSGVSFPAEVTTNRGKATITIDARTPANPRGAVDGQYYPIDVFLDAPTPSNRRTTIHVRVFDSVAVPPRPTFAAHVKPILESYARLYPGMKALLDLSDANAIRNRVNIATDPDRKKLMLKLPETDPRYMPVTRDLSKDKKQILLNWLDNGMP